VLKKSRILSNDLSLMIHHRFFLRMECWRTRELEY